MDTFLQALPWQGILNSPGSAWALLAVILVIYVMYLNGKREERMQNTIDNSIANHSQSIERQTETLTGINASLVNIQNTLCNVSNRVEDIEDVIFKDKKADQP